MINRIVIMGRLATDPELRQTPQGVAVTSFRIAVDRYAGGETKAEFFDVTAWKGTASFIESNFRKGKMIAIDGSLRTSQYEDRNGVKRNTVFIIADSVSFCGDRDPAPDTTEASGWPHSKEELNKATDDALDKDLPF